MKKMKKLKRRNLIIICVIVVIIIVFVYVDMNKKVEVETEIVDMGKVEKLIEEIAEVKSKDKFVIHSIVSGTLEDLFVSEGDRVSSGELIALIDQGTLEYDIKSTQALISSLSADFKEAIKPTDKNRILIAENNIISAKTSLDDAKKMYENNMKLFESGSISENDLEKSRMDYEISNVNYQNMLAQLSIIKKGASSNVYNKFNSEIKNLDINLDKIESIKDDYNIKSSVDAWITEKYVSIGDYVTVGLPLFELMDMENIYLQAEVLDSDALNISKGTKVNIIFEDVEYKGVVEKIYPKAYNKVSDLGIVQKRIKVDIKVDDKDTVLTLGQEVDVQFVEKVVEKELRILKDYVYDSENKKFVLVLDGDLIVEREVTLSFEGDDYYQVSSGLTAGEKVITNFGDDLIVGSKAVEK